MRRALFLWWSVVWLALPAVVFAQGIGGTGGGSIGGTGGGSGYRYSNPLGGSVGFCEFLQRVFQVYVWVGLPIAVGYLAWGGFMLVRARGNAEARRTALRAIAAAIVGTAIGFGALVILKVAINTILTIPNAANVTTLTSCV